MFYRVVVTRVTEIPICCDKQQENPMLNKRRCGKAKDTSVFIGIVSRCLGRVCIVYLTVVWW